MEACNNLLLDVEICGEQGAWLRQEKVRRVIQSQTCASRIKSQMSEIYEIVDIVPDRQDQPSSLPSNQWEHTAGQSVTLELFGWPYLLALSCLSEGMSHSWDLQLSQQGGMPNLDKVDVKYEGSGHILTSKISVPDQVQLSAQAEETTCSAHGTDRIRPFPAQCLTH